MVPPPNSGSGVGANGRPKALEQTTVDKIANSPLLFFLARIFIYAFGFFNWCLYILLAIRAGTFFTRAEETEKNQFAIGMVTTNRAISEANGRHSQRRLLESVQATSLRFQT